MVSPAALPEVIAVSAMADFDGQPGGLAPTPEICRHEGEELMDDHLAYFSNFGAPVDIAAPGVCVTSTFPGSQYADSDGTSSLDPVRGRRGRPVHVDTSQGHARKGARTLLVGRAEPGPIPGDPDPHAEGVLNIRGV